jgi:small subunit ribosomal protein MRP21
VRKLENWKRSSRREAQDALGRAANVPEFAVRKKGDLQDSAFDTIGITIIASHYHQPAYAGLGKISSSQCQLRSNANSLNSATPNMSLTRTTTSVLRSLPSSAHSPSNTVRALLLRQLSQSPSHLKQAEATNVVSGAASKSPTEIPTAPHKLITPTRHRQPGTIELSSLFGGGPAAKAEGEKRRTSADDLLNSFRAGMAGGSRRGGNTLDPSRLARTSTTSMAGLSKDSALFKSGPNSISQKAIPPPPLTLRLNASTGRSISLRNGAYDIDVGQGVRLLQRELSKNRVMYMQRKAKYHERPGLKRKRLRSERWRKRFMVGFLGYVAKAMKMKRQGW